MTFAVPSVAQTTGATSLTELTTARPQDAAPTAGAFAQSLGSVIDTTQALQADSNTKAIAAVTGDLTDIHDATIAATRAQLMIETVSALRNKAVDAFNEIMRMSA